MSKPKLSDYSLEEIDAVFQEFFKDTPTKRGDVTPKQMLRCMNSYTGTHIVLRIRFRNLGRTIKQEFLKGIGRMKK